MHVLQNTCNETLKFELRLQDENKAEGRTPPSGVVVFRRGKLPLRVGRPMEEFTQVWGQVFGHMHSECPRQLGLTSCCVCMATFHSMVAPQGHSNPLAGFYSL